MFLPRVFFSIVVIGALSSCAQGVAQGAAQGDVRGETYGGFRKGQEAEARKDWLAAVNWYNVALIDRAKAGTREPIEGAQERVRRAWVLERIEESRRLRATDPLAAWQVIEGASWLSVWEGYAERKLHEEERALARQAWIEKLESDAPKRIAAGEQDNVVAEASSFLASALGTPEEKQRAESVRRMAEASAVVGRLGDVLTCAEKGKDVRAHASQLLSAGDPSIQERARGLNRQVESLIARKQIEQANSNRPTTSIEPTRAWAWWTGVTELAEKAQDAELVRRIAAGRREWALGFVKQLEEQHASLLDVPSAQLLKDILDRDGAAPLVEPVKKRYQQAVAAFQKELRSVKSPTSVSLWTNALKAVGQPIDDERLRAALELELAQFRAFAPVVGLSNECRSLFPLNDLPQGSGPRVVIDMSGVKCNKWDSSFAPTAAQFAAVKRQSCRMVQKSAIVTVDRPCGQETVRMGVSTGNPAGTWNYIRATSCPARETVTWEEEECATSAVPELKQPGKAGRVVRGVTTSGVIYLRTGAEKLQLPFDHFIHEERTLTAGQPPPTPLPSHTEIFQYVARSASDRLKQLLIDAVAGSNAQRKQALWNAATKEGADAIAARDLLLAADGNAPGVERLQAALGLDFLGKFIRGEYVPELARFPLQVAAVELPKCEVPLGSAGNVSERFKRHEYRILHPRDLGVSGEDCLKYFEAWSRDWPKRGTRERPNW